MNPLKKKIMKNRLQQTGLGVILALYLVTFILPLIYWIITGKDPIQTWIDFIKKITDNESEHTPDL